MYSRPHRCSTNSWAAAVMLATGQRTSMVSSYQNHASPQPRTAASHCGLNNVSNAKKYRKSHLAFWLSQDIVHTVTFRGAMVVYNRTNYGKFYNKLFTSSGAPRSSRRTGGAPSPGADGGRPELHRTNLHDLTQHEKTFKRGTTITIFTSNCATIKYLRAWGDPLQPKDERHSKSGSRPRAPRAPSHKFYTNYIKCARENMLQNLQINSTKWHSRAKRALEAS